MGIIRLFFLLLFLDVLIPPATGQEIETINKYRRFKLAEDYFNQGMSCYEKNRLVEGIDDFETSVSLDPNNYLAYFFLGSSYEKTGDTDKALLNYNLSLALKPDFPEGLFNRASLYYRLGQFGEAIRDFTHLLTVPENETQAVYFRGIQYGENDSDTGFDQLLTMSTRKSDIHNYLGHCYSKQKKFDQAIRHFSKALEINPGQDLTYVNRGIVYKNMGKIDSAKWDFTKAISINPDNSLARYNLTIMDPQDDAISLAGMNEIISKYPNLPFAYANRAYYHYRQDNYQMAIQDYDSAILLDDDNHTYYLERGMCYEKMNRLGETLQNFKTAASLSPGDPDVWFNLGNVYYKQEKYDLAVEAYTRSLQLDNTGGSCYYNRGLIYHLRGEVKKACDDMKNALDLQVESAQYFLNKYCNP